MLYTYSDMKGRGIIQIVCLLLLMAVGRVYAQYGSIPLVVLDASDRVMIGPNGLPWEPESGVWVAASESLPIANYVDVFVTHEVCADSIMRWRKENTPRSRELVSAFVNEYRQRGWMLKANSKGEYNLSDVNRVATEIYGQYGPLIDWWNEQTFDPRGQYAVAILLVPKVGGQMDMVTLNERITKYDGEDERCPIYYRNLAQLDNVEKVERMSVFHRRHRNAQSDGQWLTFEENFHIQGPSDNRLVVDRLVETCIFEEDYAIVKNDLKGNPKAEQMASKLMKHDSSEEYKTYRQEPMVIAGSVFMDDMMRRMQGDLSRDTLETYRQRTQELFATNRSQNGIYYEEEDADSIQFEIPRGLWKLLSGYCSFDDIRQEICNFDNRIPFVSDATDTVRSYIIATPVSTYRRMKRYVERGHAMADSIVLSSQNQMIEGYVRHISQLDIYPLTPETRRVRVEKEGIDECLSTASKPLMLRPESLDTIFLYRWQMPDEKYYYRMKHVSYLHDFIHADTTTSEECDCQRQIPLQFIRYSAQPAQFNCPPRRDATTDETVSFRPRERGEMQDATFKLALSFEHNKSLLDLNRDSNRVQMDRLVEKAFEITHADEPGRIQQVTLIGVSSPEGRRDLNLQLSHRRSEALISMLKQMAGRDLSYATFNIVQDSIAPWRAVADRIDSIQPGEHLAAERIRLAIGEGDDADTYAQQLRIGYVNSQQDPIIGQALDGLRSVQVSYGYRALMETQASTIIQRYRRGDNPDLFPSYYFYVLFNTPLLTHAEKVTLAQRLLNHRQQDVVRFVRDSKPTNSYGLVLPMAANILACDSIQAGKWNTRILAPFIDADLEQGNLACYMRNDDETPVKFINLDVLLYNQIVMLCGEGSPESIAQAFRLYDILNYTPTVSLKFRNTYHPERLETLLNLHNRDWLQDHSKAEKVASTNLCNRYVVNLARIFEQTAGDVQSITPYSLSGELLQQCADSLSRLKDIYPSDAATLYFEAITDAWMAESINAEQQNELRDNAVEALANLMLMDERYVASIQGDSYIRNLYRNAASRKKGRDLYLEAVEQYINRLTFDNER